MRRFPFVEVLIFFAAVGLLAVIIYPQYERNEMLLQEHKARANTYAVKVGIERYAAYNEGRYPVSFNEVLPYLEGGSPADTIPGELPINPYNGEPLGVEEIVTFNYAFPSENKDDTPHGTNGQQRYTPGALGYGTFMDSDSIVVKYGLIVFNKDGEPLSTKDPSGKKHIFVLHN